MLTLRTLRVLVGVAGISAIAAGSAQAQRIAQTFDELQEVAKVGQRVVVTDTDGARIKGRLTQLTATKLVVSTPEPRIFDEGTVAKLEAVDSLKNGMLLGALVGAGYGLWDHLIDVSEPGNITLLTLGAGAGIGAWMDSLGKGDILYLSPQLAAGLRPSHLLRAGTRRAFLVGANLGWHKRQVDHYFPDVLIAGEAPDRAMASGFSAGVFLSPRTSMSGELVRFAPSTFAFTTRSFARNDQMRAAGLLDVEDETRDYSEPYSFSALLGYHPFEDRRVQLAFLGGVAFKPYEDVVTSKWYSIVWKEDTLPPKDTHFTSFGSTREFSFSARYTHVAMALGVDAKALLFERLAVVPQIRLDLSPHYGPKAIRAGVGVQWLFRSRN